MQKELRDILALFFEAGYNRGAGVVSTGEALEHFEGFVKQFSPTAWDGVTLIRYTDTEESK